MKKGILDKWKSGDFNTQKEVEALGIDELAEKTAQWNKAESKTFKDNQAKMSNLNTDHSKVAEEIATGATSTFTGLPEELQNFLLPAGALGAGLLYRKPLKKAISKLFSPKVGDLPGTKPPTGLVDQFGKPLVSAVDDVIPANPSFMSKVKDWGGNVADRSKALGGKLLGDTSGLLTKGAPVIAKRIPIVGSLLGTGIDQAMNPENSWGKSIAKGVGGTIGGILGVAGAGALGIGTGGAGFLAAGAMGMGGAVAGEKSAEWLYDLFSGEKDKKVEDSSKKDVSMKEDPILGDTSKEKVVRIILEGDIKGMDKKNQDAVSSSITSYFEGIVSPYSANSGQFRYNLALDQTRG